MSDGDAYARIAKIPGVIKVELTYENSAMAGSGYSGAVFASTGANPKAIAEEALRILRAARPNSSSGFNVIIDDTATSTEQLGLR